MSLEPLAVLAVDDNRIIRDMVARAVAMSGLPTAKVDQAADGRQALFMLGAGAYHLVMLDINMPLMNGEQLLTAMRAEPRYAGMMVVVVSTESSPARIARLRALGAEFIHKPFRPEELVAAVQRLVAGRIPT